MKNYKVLLLSFSIIIAALIVSFSNRYKPSPVNESFVIDSGQEIFMTFKETTTETQKFKSI